MGVVETARSPWLDEFERDAIYTGDFEINYTDAFTEAKGTHAGRHRIVCYQP